MDKATKRRTILIVQIVLAVLVVVGAGWLILKVMGYNQAQQFYRDMETAYAAELNSDSSEEAIDFAKLKEACPDVVAWIRIEDLGVSYPVVQGQDNDHYLHNDSSNAQSVDGAIFLDYRNKSFGTDLHALVYGHNMMDGSMFGTLQRFTNEEFLRNGSGLFTIYTPSATYHYQIFALNIVDPQDEAYTVGYQNGEVFSGFVKNLKDRSMFETGVDASDAKQVVTLSTCSDSDRLIVSGKRIDAKAAKRLAARG